MSTGKLEDRAPIPEPSSLDTMMNDPENRDAVALPIEVGARPAKLSASTSPQMW
jgi:hypothetical protein